MSKTKKKPIPGKDGLHRMNFLHQASQTIALKKPMDLACTSLYGSHLVSVGKKLQQKIDPSMKRMICKGCSGILIPGISATVRVKGSSQGKCKKFNPKRKFSVWTCLQCRFSRRYPLDPNYELWSEQSESHNKM